MEDKYFTLYWLNGDRSIISGPSIERAFTAAGYGAGAVAAVDWYDEGITETHYRNKIEKKWVKYEPLHIHIRDIRSYSEETLVELFHKHHNITVECGNSDQLILQQSIGNFATIGWVKHLVVVFAEYFEGGYFEDSEEDHHFMMAASQYFKPSNLNKAVSIFMSRLTSQRPYKALGESEQLEDIHTADSSSV